MRPECSSQTGSGSLAVASESPLCFLVPRMDRPGHQGIESGPGAGTSASWIWLRSLLSVLVSGSLCPPRPRLSRVLKDTRVCPTRLVEAAEQSWFSAILSGRVDDVSDHQLRYGAPAPERRGSPGRPISRKLQVDPRGSWGPWLSKGHIGNPSVGASGCHNIWGSRYVVFPETLDVWFCSEQEGEE